MNFQVEPVALDGLAKLLERAKEDVEASRTHLEVMREFEGGEGVINMIVGGHQEVYQALDGWLSKLANPALTATEQSVTDAADYYQRTDDTSARELDATYPKTNLDEVREHTDYDKVEPPENTGRFADVCDASQNLNLGDPDKYHKELDGSMNWWDALSLSALAGNAFEGATGLAASLGLMDRAINPQDEFVRPFVGDWAAVRQAADVLRNVGHALIDIATNLDWASQGVEDVWQGNAGNGAAVYLMNLARPLHDCWGPIDKLAAAYETAAGEMVKLRDAAVNILNEIGDAVIQAAASAGVAGGAISTGVGAPVGIFAAAFSGYKIYRVVDGVEKLFDVIGQLDAVTAILKTTQTDFGNIQQGIKLPPLPHSPLDAPK